MSDEAIYESMELRVENLIAMGTPDSVLLEAFDSNPFAYTKQQKGSRTEYFFTGDKDEEYRIQMIGAGAGTWGAKVDTIFIGKRRGSGKVYADSIDKITNPNKVISTLLNIVTEYTTNDSKGMNKDGFAVSLSGKAAKRFAPVLRKVLGRTMKGRLAIVRGSQPDPKREFVWVHRTTKPVDQVFNGKKIPADFSSEAGDVRKKAVKMDHSAKVAQRDEKKIAKAEKRMLTALGSGVNAVGNISKSKSETEPTPTVRVAGSDDTPTKTAAKIKQPKKDNELSVGGDLSALSPNVFFDKEDGFKTEKEVKGVLTKALGPDWTVFVTHGFDNRFDIVISNRKVTHPNGTVMENNFKQWANSDQNFQKVIEWVNTASYGGVKDKLYTSGKQRIASKEYHGKLYLVVMVGKKPRVAVTPPPVKSKTKRGRNQVFNLTAPKFSDVVKKSTEDKKDDNPLAMYGFPSLKGKFVPPEDYQIDDIFKYYRYEIKFRKLLEKTLDGFKVDITTRSDGINISFYNETITHSNARALDRLSMQFVNSSEQFKSIIDWVRNRFEIFDVGSYSTPKKGSFEFRVVIAASGVKKNNPQK